MALTPRAVTRIVSGGIKRHFAREELILGRGLRLFTNLFSTLRRQFPNLLRSEASQVYQRLIPTLDAFRDFNVLDRGTRLLLQDIPTIRSEQGPWMGVERVRVGIDVEVFPEDSFQGQLLRFNLNFLGSPTQAEFSAQLEAVILDTIATYPKLSEAFGDVEEFDYEIVSGFIVKRF